MTSPIGVCKDAVMETYKTNSRTDKALKTTTKSSRLKLLKHLENMDKGLKALQETKDRGKSK